MSGPLPHIGLLRFVGPDAHSFLQGQVSNDTRRLERGAPLLAAYSTPQGRVVAVLHLLPHSSGVIALLPREMVPPTLERLRRFVLRAKVTMEDLSEQLRRRRRARLRRRCARPGCAFPMPRGYVEQDGIGVGRVSAGPEPVLGDRPRGFPGGARSRRRRPRQCRRQPRHASNGTGAWRTFAPGLPQVYAATASYSSRKC